MRTLYKSMLATAAFLLLPSGCHGREVDIVCNKKGIAVFLRGGPHLEPPTNDLRSNKWRSSGFDVKVLDYDEGLYPGTNQMPHFDDGYSEKYLVSAYEKIVKFVSSANVESCNSDLYIVGESFGGYFASRLITDERVAENISGGVIYSSFISLADLVSYRKDLKNKGTGYENDVILKMFDGLNEELPFGSGDLKPGVQVVSSNYTTDRLVGESVSVSSNVDKFPSSVRDNIVPYMISLEGVDGEAHNPYIFAEEEFVICKITSKDGEGYDCPFAEMFEPKLNN